MNDERKKNKYVFPMFLCVAKYLVEDGSWSFLKHKSRDNQFTEVRFASLLSGGFTTMAVINPPEKKLANSTSVQCSAVLFSIKLFT